MIKFQKSTALYQQIASYFENEIVEGRLLQGDRIPATTKLSRQFGVNSDTIQQSLTLLASRGLVERAPGRGTFVRRGVNSMTVGIVFGKEIYTDPDVMFFSVFLDCLTRTFETKGWNCKLFSTSEFASYDKAFYELKTSVESGEVRAVVEFCSNTLIRDWLKNECPAPVNRTSLAIDFADFTYSGLTYLYECGCRNPAVLAYEVNDNLGEYRKGVRRFCQAHGLPETSVALSACGSHAREGYAQIRKLFNQDVRPDGFLAANDGAFRGALYALLELGVNIPDDMKLVTYANKGVEIFCHLPLTKLEVDPDQFAFQNYERLIARIDGRTSLFDPVKATLVAGKTCGEQTCLETV
jgi:DNA-binding LacI/PurR family transcriptional regulator